MADEKDLAFVEGLQSLGAKRNVALLVTYLKGVNEAPAREIEMATGLRQPEVSIAMRTLRGLGWITEREVKGDGKGRPLRIYALRPTLEEIIQHYEEKKLLESDRVMKSIQKLKELGTK